jgi:putative transposase
MTYDPHKHHRRSIRLKGYDYSQAGMYFVTICVQRGQCLLTETAVQEMIQYWWEKLPEKFTAVVLDAFVIMPNHFHFIIVITAVDPQPYAGTHPPMQPSVGTHLLTQPPVGAHPRVRPKGQTHGPAPTAALGKIVQWFKTMTTNAYIRGVKEQGWEPFPGKLWQRNYYEHIIRNGRALNTIRQYIDNNPANWDADQLHPDAPPNSFNQTW